MTRMLHSVMVLLWGVAAADTITGPCKDFWSQPIISELAAENGKTCVQGVVRQQPELLFDATCVEVLCCVGTVKSVTPMCISSDECSAFCQEQGCNGCSQLCDSIQNMGKGTGLWSTGLSSHVLAALPPGMPSRNTRPGRSTAVPPNRPHLNISNYVKSLATIPVDHVNLSLLLKGDDMPGFPLGWFSFVGLSVMMLALIVRGRWTSQPVSQEPLLG